MLRSIHYVDGQGLLLVFLVRAFCHLNKGQYFYQTVRRRVAFCLSREYCINHPGRKCAIAIDYIANSHESGQITLPQLALSSKIQWLDSADW